MATSPFLLSACVAVSACAGGSAQSGAARGPQAANEQILDAGGQLPPRFPLDSVQVTASDVQCGAFLEGPANSPLESLYAKAADQAREDYRRFLAVAVAHLDLQLQGAGQEGARPAEAAAVTEKASAVHLGSPEQAWQKVDREGSLVVRVFVRYRVPRREVEKAFAAGLAGRPSKDAIVERTFSGMQDDVAARAKK